MHRAKLIRSLRLSLATLQHIMKYPCRLHVKKTFEKILELLPPTDQTKPQIAVLVGSVTPYRNDTDREMLFRQESNFFYLSGCNVPGSILLLVYEKGTSFSEPLIEIFVPEVEPADLMWSVPPPNAAELQDISEASRVAYIPAFTEAFLNLIKAFPEALVHVLPLESPAFPQLSREYLDLAKNSTVTDAYLLPAVHKARLIKTDYEISEIRRANEISSRAHEVVMRVLGCGVRNLIKTERGAGVSRPLLPGEWLIEKEAEAEAIFVASCRREGAIHQAYLPIVAASTRAATLHYCCNDKEFAWGPIGANDHHDHSLVNGHSKTFIPQVLLIDAGCEWNNYASDITRVTPVGNGGKFTPEARAIYDLVLEMQKASIDALQPGLHWDTVQFLCHRILVKGFQKLGIFFTPESPGSGSWNSEESILASGISTAFFPHGVGHSLGLDVHDVPSASKPKVNDTIGKGVELGHPDFYNYLRLRLPLESGMVVTVEPGIYFHEHLLSFVRTSRHVNHEVLKKYELVGGVRIEDVVLITVNGCENLTTVGKETSWVEGLSSGEM